MSAIDGNFVYQKTLSCGRIEVSSEETDYPLTDLFDIAERRNPKRAFLFVSKVLGRHNYPVSAAMRQTVAEAQTLVLVDDEATTGKTFLNLLAALRASGALRKVRRVIAVTLTDWSGEALYQNCPLPLHTVSLISGNWRWTPEPDAPLPVMPQVNVTSRGNIPITGKQSWGRLGMQIPASDLGLQVQVGLGIPNYVYNVAHQQFDRILICCETPVASVDPRLLEALSAVAPTLEVITYE